MAMAFLDLRDTTTLLPRIGRGRHPHNPSWDVYEDVNMVEKVADRGVVVPVGELCGERDHALLFVARMAIFRADTIGSIKLGSIWVFVRLIL